MDSFKRLVEKMMKEQRRLQEQMNRALRPSDALQEAMNRALGPSDAFREQVKKMMEPYHGLSDAVRQMMNQEGSQARALQRETQKLMQKFQEPLIEKLRMKETITESINLHKRVADQFMKIPPAQHFTWISEAKMHWAAGAESYLSRFDPESIKVSPTGDIAQDRETVNAEDVTSGLELLNKELAGVSTPDEYVQLFFSILARLKPLLAFAIIHLILPYVSGVLGDLTAPIYEPYWKEFTGISKEEAATKVREKTLNRYDPSQLKDHRFVTANRLQVRAGPGKEQRVIGTLPRGKLVRIIRAKQHWTKVEYLDERQQKERRGWVAASHLGKLTE